MRWLIILLFVAACAPVEGPPLAPQLPKCTTPEILIGEECCLDANANGMCDVEEPDEPGVPTKPIQENLAFTIHLDMPQKVVRGVPFNLTVGVESFSNVPLEPGRGHVRIVYANPRAFGLSSLSQLRREILEPIAPGVTHETTYVLTLDEEFEESSTINLEIRFCYAQLEYNEKCVVTTRLVGIE